MASRPTEITLAGKRSSTTIPKGVEVPMCFCGDRCKLVKSELLGSCYGMRWFMCANYEYEPPKAVGYEIHEVVHQSVSILFLFLLCLLTLYLTPRVADSSSSMWFCAVA